MFWGYVIAVLVVLVVVGVPLTAMILSLLALARTRQMHELVRRVQRLEAAQRDQPPARAGPASPDSADVAPAEPAARQPAGIKGPSLAERILAIDWEKFVGQKALGWAAVVLLTFAAVFFLRYAYQNNWVGPLGRVAVSALVGIGLVVAGHYYHCRDWRVLARMFSAGGMVIVYLAVYSAFGLYDLLPQTPAAAFLAIIVLQCALLAVMYDSTAIGLVSVLGGLATPLLLQADRDAFVALFTYLAVLNLGTVLLMLLRSWPAIGSVALIGTQAVYWIWYSEYYHPEKLAWALGFQLVLFGLYLGQVLIAQLLLSRRATWDDLARVIMMPVAVFAAAYVLLEPDYDVWMGSAALAVATIHAGLALAALTGRSRDERLSVTCLAVAVGFIALAFPIQANTHWVAFGWAAMAAALWWFGLRIHAPLLRGGAAVLGGLAVTRVLMFDLPTDVREPFIPVLNEFALPAVGVALCLLAAVGATGWFPARLGRLDKSITYLGGLAGILLLWLVLSLDCYQYFEARARIWTEDRARLLWLAQLSLSVLWAVYASLVLAAGFRWRLAPLRWLAIGLYLVTILKVFFVDMANLEQFYRILAFFVLAIVLGIAARAYQKLGASLIAQQSEGT